MVIDHADGLHVSVTDGAADEVEATLLQVLAQCIGGRRARRNLFRRSPRTLYRFAVHETPNIGIEAPEHLLNLQEGTSITHCGLDLQAVAHDVAVFHELCDPPGIEARDTQRVELRKSMAITVASL